MIKEMSGELISNHKYSQAKNVTMSKSYNTLFDLNDDGKISGVEADRMESAGLYNTLESVSPLIAKAFSNSNFRINRMSMLTPDELQLRRKMFEIIGYHKAKWEEAKINRRMPTEKVYDEEDDEFEEMTQDLNSDLRDRTYLEQTEINNDP